MSYIDSFSIFFLSYFPLWISILFIDIRNIVKYRMNVTTEILSVVVIILILCFSLIRLFRWLHYSDSNGAQEYMLDLAEEDRKISSEYLLAYILPMVAFDFTIWYQFVLFLFFFIVLTFLYIRHNSFYATLILEILGYRFYKCKLKNEDGIAVSKVIMSKDDLLVRKAEMVVLIPINNEVSRDIQDWSKMN